MLYLLLLKENGGQGPVVGPLNGLYTQHGLVHLQYSLFNTTLFTIGDDIPLGAELYAGYAVIKQDQLIMLPFPYMQMSLGDFHELNQPSLKQPVPDQPQNIPW